MAVFLGLFGLFAWLDLSEIERQARLDPTIKKASHYTSHEGEESEGAMPTESSPTPIITTPEIDPSVPQQAAGQNATPELRRPRVVPSPRTMAEFRMDEGSRVVAIAASPADPTVAVIVDLGRGRQQLIYWAPSKGKGGARKIDLPEGISLSTAAWHPEGEAVYLLGRMSSESVILRVDPRSNVWQPSTILQTDRLLRNLVFGPQTFGVLSRDGIGIARYRMFFGVAGADRQWGVYTATEEGERIYPVITSEPDTDFSTWSKLPGRYPYPPGTLSADYALPAGFHPGGYILLWTDAENCIRSARYGYDNWVSVDALDLPKAVMCRGEVGYVPNGAAILHWQSGKAGVRLFLTGRKLPVTILADRTFASSPYFLADGRGIVGVLTGRTGSKIGYFPVRYPLADVANAWQFVSTEDEWKSFERSNGLFRPLGGSDAGSNFPSGHGYSIEDSRQLYSLYEYSTYQSCRGVGPEVDHPNLVTTDLMWDLFAAAFEGTFIVTERQLAIPAFTEFLKEAAEFLRARHPEAKLVPILSALNAILADKVEQNALAREILGEPEYQPRGHYSSDSELGR